MGGFNNNGLEIILAGRSHSSNRCFNFFFPKYCEREEFFDTAKRVFFYTLGRFSFDDTGY